MRPRPVSPASLGGRRDGGRSWLRRSKKQVSFSCYDHKVECQNYLGALLFIPVSLRLRNQIDIAIGVPEALLPLED
jgi:hypothetical protein